MWALAKFELLIADLDQKGLVCFQIKDMLAYLQINLRANRAERIF